MKLNFPCNKPEWNPCESSWVSLTNFQNWHVVFSMTASLTTGGRKHSTVVLTLLVRASGLKNGGFRYLSVLLQRQAVWFFAFESALILCGFVGVLSSSCGSWEKLIHHMDKLKTHMSSSFHVQFNHHLHHQFMIKIHHHFHHQFILLIQDISEFFFSRYQLAQMARQVPAACSLRESLGPSTAVQISFLGVPWPQIGGKNWSHLILVHSGKYIQAFFLKGLIF